MENLQEWLSVSKIPYFPFVIKYLFLTIFPLIGVPTPDVSVVDLTVTLEK